MRPSPLDGALQPVRMSHTDTPERTERVPIYRYTLTLKDGSTRQVDAMSYELDGPWMIFDDTATSVLTIREELVNEVARGEQVSEQVVDAL